MEAKNSWSVDVFLCQGAFFNFHARGVYQNNDIRALYINFTTPRIISASLVDLASYTPKKWQRDLPDGNLHPHT